MEERELFEAKTDYKHIPVHNLIKECSKKFKTRYAIAEENYRVSCEYIEWLEIKLKRNEEIISKIWHLTMKN